MANYEKYLKDSFTGEIALIKSNDYYIFQQKIQQKEEMWAKKRERLKKLQTKEQGQNQAETSTQNALQEIEACKNILNYTLAINDRVQWEELYDKTIFKKFEYDKLLPSETKFYIGVPNRSFWEYIFKSLKVKREKLENEAKEKYNNALNEYEKEKQDALNKYNVEKEKFESLKAEHNGKIDNLRLSFEKSEPEAICNYLEIVFNKSKYPSTIQLNYDISYIKDRRTVLVEVFLPNPDEIPVIIEYKYIASKNDFSTKTLNKKEIANLYEEIIAQIIIRTIHEVFESIYIDVLDFVVCNGYVTALNKRTGHQETNCIVSVQAEKSYFDNLNLKNVSAKDCISGLKGIIASEFINIAPVKPILHLNRDDKRIIETDTVIDKIDETNNLADMDWQKFESLVRDLFSKEFAGEGVEVKVTQASRDQGVDAIIFDPNPIKGGKFVIQAKRYNNVVGVSAVRDLYGTVMNEGAVKGILVTTSFYGKDSIEFAKDKPLTLITGAELVYLFNKHGYKVTIETKKK